MKQSNRSDVQQMLGDKKMLEQVAKSPDAQALAGLLTQGRDQAALKKIAADAGRSCCGGWGTASERSNSHFVREGGREP